ncbi:Malic enzyme NAD-binding [Penicillium antarcticum]|uniref:Malic enzyme NAD-binding n=1 Tax=Penicillium antarcticum TaxID=416450 RepID=UPI0023A788EB|nr:Malic enzyme NAD-binding [Penicillium antarcticum]KAJ5295779.1 Malic enzyme NAD-binding [Penicillium antarcticum]
MTNSKQVQTFAKLPRANTGPVECPHTGAVLLQSSQFNKGSAFPSNERTEFKLHSLLPPNIQTLDEQVERAYQQYQSHEDDLSKNVFLASKKAQNEVLYYKLLQDHLKEMFGVIYTPTEGDAIQNYSRLFRRPEGCFLNIHDQDRIEEDLSAFGTADDIDYIVVSDGEEILGDGDQGVGAILISVAKLVLTTLCAGIHPSRQLPIVLDCGTDNQSLLDDQLYLGLRQYRVRGEAYDAFVEKFVQATRKRFPKAFIHFEDFGPRNAQRILDKYQFQIPCFNDDIQGTGCVTLAAMLAALQISHVALKNVHIIIFGSGTAGIGIADQIVEAISNETRIPVKEASKQIWCLDTAGLLIDSLGDGLTDGQRRYTRADDEWPDHDRDLLTVIKRVKPHVLIGTSTKGGAFTEEIIREMAQHVKRPIIFPLSNPTRRHEAIPKDLYEWTDGRALIATGSPFSAVEYSGREYDIAQCNNSVCFPGIGLGAVLSQSRLVTKKMIAAAVEALKDRSPVLRDASLPLLPGVEEVRDISIDIAAAVIKTSVQEGLARADWIPHDDSDLRFWIQSQMWEAFYRPLVRVD